MAGGFLNELGTAVGEAVGPGLGFAARGEGAAGDSSGEARRHSGNGVEVRSLGLEGRDGALEGARVGVERLVEELTSGCALEDLAGIHDVDAVAKSRDDREVVGDEYDGGAEVSLAFANEIEDLGLNGDVKRGRRFVGDEDLGPRDERHRDHDTLTHAAGELVGVAVNALGGFGNADFLKSVDGTKEGFLSGDRFVEEERLDELRGDAQEGVKRGHRVLEDHRDATAANGAQDAFVGREKVDTVEHRSAALDLAWRHGDEAEERVASNRFSTAGFADDADGLAFVEVEGDAIDGADDAVARVEVGFEIGDFQEWHRWPHFYRLKGEMTRIFSMSRWSMVDCSRSERCKGGWDL